jgi:curved DNA-binding protein CbpA
MDVTLYSVLGVTEDATPDDVRRAWRDAARRLHPDLHPNEPDAEERFKAASAAWETLGDADRRAEYDAWLEDERQPKCPRCGAAMPEPRPLCQLCALTSSPPRKPKPPKPQRSKKPKPAPPPTEEEEQRARKVAQERATAETFARAEGSIPPPAVPYTDLLESLLGDAARRTAARPRKKDDKDVEIEISPIFTVRLPAETVDAVREVNKGIGTMNRFLRNVRKLFK